MLYSYIIIIINFGGKITNKNLNHQMFSGFFLFGVQNNLGSIVARCQSVRCQMKKCRRIKICSVMRTSIDCHLFDRSSVIT